MFDQVKERIAGLERRNRVTIQDVLDVFELFCQDAALERGVDSFEDLPTGDATRMAEGTMLLLRRANSLYQRKRIVFSAEAFSERWDAAEAECTEASRRLNEMELEKKKLDRKKLEAANTRRLCEALERNIIPVRQEWEAAKMSLECLESQQREMSGQIEDLKRKAVEAEAERRRCERELLPEAEKNFANVQASQRSVQKKLDELTGQIRELEAVLTEKEGEKEEALKTLKNLETRLEGLAEEKEKEIREAEEQISAKKQQLADQKAKLEKQKEKILECSDLCVQCEHEENAIRKEAASCSEHLKDVRTQVEAGKRELEELRTLCAKELARLEAEDALWRDVWADFQEEWKCSGETDTGKKAELETMLKVLGQQRMDFGKAYLDLVRRLEKGGF